MKDVGMSTLSCNPCYSLVCFFALPSLLYSQFILYLFVLFCVIANCHHTFYILRRFVYSFCLSSHIRLSSGVSEARSWRSPSLRLLLSSLVNQTTSGYCRGWKSVSLMNRYNVLISAVNFLTQSTAV